MLNNLRQYLRIKRASLIFRLLFYFILSMVIVALILSINFTSQFKPRFKNDLLPNLARYIEYVVDDIGLPPDLNKARLLAFDLPFEIRIEGAVQPRLILFPLSYGNLILIAENAPVGTSLMRDKNGNDHTLARHAIRL